MEKKKESKTHKKVAEVMHEFKEKKLHIGTSDMIVTDQKQAIDIALSDADKLPKSKK